ncbi:hypothetical protein ABTX81_27275 [Kitasatospora sp. NPDC097605]|uniref:hypothetical protein n=1 Tax=Kitasatospora sp. NPDC097605 TaxID=3157226 RepID=UPI00331E06FB
MDGRLPEDVGRAALTAADLQLVQEITTRELPIDPGATGPDLLILDRTGRMLFLWDASRAPAGSHVVGSLVTDPETRAELRRRYLDREAAEEADRAELRTYLMGRPPERNRADLARLGHVLLHMAPVQVYVGDRLFSNLGSSGNLPGKSIAPTASENILARLAALPAGEWSKEEAAFVALSTVLLSSGTQARLEEANGTHLTSAGVAALLTGHIRGYGAEPPDVEGVPPVTGLEALARRCAAERRARLGDGTVFYRLIHGANLNKTEHLLRPALGYADVPLPLRALLEREAGIGADTTTIGETAPAFEALSDTLHAAPAPERFSSAYEALLSRFMATLAEATASDVAMGRGPRSFAPLEPGGTGEDDPLALRSNDFFCCVAPSAAFAESFGEDRAALVKTLSAYSARMRFNSWHYLPHTLGITDRVPGRDDWFFAPTMPDLTHHSDQHHTGHVAFHVRYAIRVPLGIDHAGRHLPGLYDLRLMRGAGERYTTDDLRAAVASGRVLAVLHQAMSRHRVTVRDFGNEWFRARYG